jgi:type II secretory pathway component PulJ
MGTATMIARHQVQDYSTWRAVYDSLEGARQSYNCTGAEVMTDPGNKNDVFVIHRFPTVEAAQAFAGSSELKEAMGRAGVAGAPRIEIAAEA